MRELDYVSRIFHGSKDPRGRKLFWKCDDLKEKFKSKKMDSKAVCRAILMFFQGTRNLVFSAFIYIEREGIKLL